MKTIVQQCGMLESAFADPKRRAKENKTIEVKLKLEFFTTSKKKMLRKIEKEDLPKIGKKLKSLSNSFGRGLLKHSWKELPIDVSYIVELSLPPKKHKKGE